MFCVSNLILPASKPNFLAFPAEHKIFSRPKLKQYFLNHKIKENGHSENPAFLSFGFNKKSNEKLKFVT
jgi:hypothetical protein